jgi:predicted RNase H-like HicB family nuclease
MSWSIVKKNELPVIVSVDAIALKFVNIAAKRITLIMTINYTIETEREEDGRIIAEVIELPGVLAYGNTKQEAIAKVQALALHVIADKLEHGEATFELLNLCFVAS